MSSAFVSANRSALVPKVPSFLKGKKSVIDTQRDTKGQRKKGTDFYT